jgi:hypothetical protein
MPDYFYIFNRGLNLRNWVVLKFNRMVHCAFGNLLFFLVMEAIDLIFWNDHDFFLALRLWKWVSSMQFSLSSHFSNRGGLCFFRSFRYFHLFIYNLLNILFLIINWIMNLHVLFFFNLFSNKLILFYSIRILVNLGIFLYYLLQFYFIYLFFLFMSLCLWFAFLFFCVFYLLYFSVSILFFNYLNHLII